MRSFRSATPIGRGEVLVLALFALCLADMAGGGYATWPAFAALAASLVLFLVAMVQHERLPWGSVPPLTGPAFAALMVLRFGLGVPVVIWSATAMAILAALASLTSYPLIRYLSLAALLLTWAVTVGLWLAIFPIHIDVLTVLHGGAMRLLHGLNPYTGSYRSTTPGVRTVPYDYGPVTVLLSVPGVLLGHVRYANAVLGAAGLLALSALASRAVEHRGLTSYRALIPTTICLPLMTLLIWSGWTDVYVVAPLGWWLLVRDRHPRVAIAFLAAAFGGTLLVAPFMVPLVLWSPRVRRETVFAAAGALLVLYCPFILWTGASRFLYDTVGVFIGLPAIPHSLALQSLLVFFGLPGPNLVVTVVLLVAVCVALTFWKPSDLSDLLLASAAFGFVAFLVNRWAFFDYWALVCYVLLAAAATVGTSEPTALPHPLARGHERLLSFAFGAEHDAS